MTWTPARSGMCFNEASAFRRGNPGLEREAQTGADASMRPRHFAEEIHSAADAGCGGGIASMRPRHFAEEILCRDGPGRFPDPASMRPRHFAEEIREELRAAGNERRLQ